MRALALTSLLLCSLPAFAGTPLDKYDTTAGSVTVAGVTEVPIYRIRDDDRMLVRVKVSADREATFVLTASGTAVKLSEDLAKELKLSVKSGNKHAVNLKGEENAFRAGGEIKQATLASASLGGLTLNDLKVTVSGGLGSIYGFPIEGTLPLTLFPSQLAFAAVPSKGVLRIGPAVEGGHLVTGLGGAALPYESVGREKFKNKVRGYKVKGFTDPTPLIVDASIGGAPMKVGLGGETCDVTPTLDLGAAQRRSEGDQTLAWLSATVAGVETAPDWYVVNGGYHLQLGPVLPIQGQICDRVLSRFDLAIDPVAQKVSLVAASADGRVDAETLLYQAVLAASQKAPEAPEKPDKSGEPPKPPPGPLITLVKVQMARGEDPTATAQKIIELDDKDCSAWTRLGEGQVAVGRYSDAVTSLSKASELYHAWWDQPLEEREKLSKKLAKAKTDEEKAAIGHTEQAPSCHTADGDLALVYLAMGDLTNVQRLYVERLDLDPQVALAAAGAALVEGKPQQASAAYRQAIKRERVGQPLAEARLGIGLANAPDWVAAAPAFDEALAMDRGANPLGLLAWLDGVRRGSGPEAAFRAATALSEAQPDSLGAAVMLFREAQLASDPAAQAVAAARVSDLERRPSHGEPEGYRLSLIAYYTVLRGDLETAANLANQAISSFDADPIAWLTLAEISRVQGDTQKATEYLQQVAARGAGNPAAALIAAELR